MSEQYNEEWARSVIDDGAAQAEHVVEDPNQLDDLLQQLQTKLSGLPDTVGTAFNNVPLMASMVKSYITREYTEVSPKVIISLVSVFLYLVKKKDIIPDDIPVVGLADDVAVATIAMVINEPELAAYAAWREQQEAATAEQAPSNADAPADAVDVVIEPAQ